VHDVRNLSVAPAVSVHAYSKPLTSMTCYDLADGGARADREPGHRRSGASLRYPGGVMTAAVRAAYGSVEELLDAAGRA